MSCGFTPFSSSSNTAQSPSSVASTGSTSSEEASPRELEEKRLKGEFKKAWPAFYTYGMDLDWCAVYTELTSPVDYMQLATVDVGPLYAAIISNRSFGLLPQIALFSEYNIGSLLSESVCERVFSACKYVIHDGRTLLSEEHLEMIIMLRMNARCMEKMRVKYKGFTLIQLQAEAEKVKAAYALFKSQ
jgi:hypothetical protein